MTLDDWIGGARTFSFDGHDIAYWTSGDGRPLLLVHGYPTSSWDWHRVWPALADRHRLIACDMLGFGLSAKPRSGYSIHQQAELQEALLDYLSVDEFDAVVHDYGDTVGQELLARRNHGSGAHGLGRMLFLNGGLFPEQHRARPVQKLGTSRLGFIVGLLLNRRKFGAAFSEVFGPDTQPTEAELDEHWRLITHNNGHRLMHKLLHYIAERGTFRERWVGALQEAAVPIRLVAGAADPVSGRHMVEHFRKLVPGVDAVCLDRIGHYPQIEAPGSVIDEVLPFLATA